MWQSPLTRPKDYIDKTKKALAVEKMGDDYFSGKSIPDNVPSGTEKIF